MSTFQQPRSLANITVLQRLNRQIEITAKYPIFCGGYADIFPGIWRSGPPFLGPGVWTGNATSGRNVAVGTAHIYIGLCLNSRTLPCVKVAIKVLRMANHANNPRAQRKCAWASINGFLSHVLGLVLIGPKPTGFGEGMSCLGTSSSSKCASFFWPD